ncbi:MAG: hypothetical protein WBX19_11395, partial [Terracidiphilus sp.]
KPAQELAIFTGACDFTRAMKDLCIMEPGLKNIHRRNGEPIWLTSFFAVASKTPCEPLKTVEHQKRPLGASSNHSIQLGPS